MLQTHCLQSSTFPFSLSHRLQKFYFLHKPTISLSALPRRRPIIEPWLSQAQEPNPTIAPTTSAATEEGPIELTQSIFANTDDPSPLQVSTSVLLTGSIAVFLFRSLRRLAKRAKELDLIAFLISEKNGILWVYKFRSTGAKKALKEEAMYSLKASSIEAKSPPSTVQALLGAISAGGIALILM